MCNFYTGMRTVKEFDVSHNSAARFVKREQQEFKKKSSSVVRKYKKKAKSSIPKPKYGS